MGKVSFHSIGTNCFYVKAERMEDLELWDLVVVVQNIKLEE